MPVFIVSDIFGTTNALKRLCGYLCKKKFDAKIIDPYGGQSLSFESEPRAYEYFMTQVGLDRYSAIIKNSLVSARPDTVLIGFSVGASAVWSLSSNKSLTCIKKAICFYSSQIRYFLDTRPRFDVELIFPNKEPHFNVNNIIKHLADTPRVFCSKAPGNHGFMNELSVNYDPVLYAFFTDHLESLIQKRQAI